MKIPKLRTGSFFPLLLERRRRIDRALFAVVMGAYVHGVSTGEVDDLVQALGVSDVRMEQGSLRCDANVSLRASSDAPYGLRTETKNVNSLRSVERALAYEMRRQGAVLASGGRTSQVRVTATSPAGDTVFASLGATGRPRPDGLTGVFERRPVVDGPADSEVWSNPMVGVARALGFAVLSLVTDLELIDTPAGDEAMKAAAALPALTRLTVSGTLVTDNGISALKAAKKLEAVDLRRTKVTETAVKALATALPGCRIEWDGGVIEAMK